jgi:hypothetical protein
VPQRGTADRLARALQVFRFVVHGGNLNLLGEECQQRFGEPEPSFLLDLQSGKGS